MDKILFATLYRKESIIKLLFDLDPISKLILIVDKEKDKWQSQNLEFIKTITKTKDIKVKQVEVEDIFNFEAIVETFHKEVSKFKTEELYFDVSHSKRTLGYALITYLSINYPNNLKTVYAYSSSDNQQMEVPIFKAEELSEKEEKALEYIEKNSKFFQKHLADHLEVSVVHAGRILDDIIKKQLVTKETDYKLTKKGNVYLIVKK